MSKESSEQFWERLLRERPEIAKWKLDDMRAEICRLQAKIEDAERRHTANGYYANGEEYGIN
jgi:hypothetical protein